MEYEIVTLPEKLAVGVSARTSNASPDMTAVIGSLWNRFFSEGIHAALPGKVTGKPLGIYTDYAHDETAAYTAMVACETTDPTQPDGCVCCKIPAGQYAKFVVRGDMVQAVAKAWQEIWQMKLPRSFRCDFEEYQNDSRDQAEIHIYISLADSPVQSRCGILCGQCEFRETMNCAGCLHIEKPFWGESCPVKSCCEEKNHLHCGECPDFPCALLNDFAYDKEQGDDGLRIAQCRCWRGR